jgi:hypothetical protein
MMKTSTWFGALLASLGAAGCCLGGSTATPTPTPVVAPTVVAGPPAGAPFTVAPGLPEWNDSYSARRLGDGTNTSYWCTGVSPTYPIVATLSLSPTALTGVDFDTRLPGYETSAVRVVTVETLGSGGLPLDTQTVELGQNAVSSLSYAAPQTATQVRLTFHSNFGGSYAGLGEVVLRTGAPTGVPVRAAAAPQAGLPYVVAPTLPVWNDGYSAARMQDGNASTYWCTPMSPTFPFTGSFSLAAPATLSQVVFDNRLPGYETSGVRGVTVNAYGPDGLLATTTSAELPQNAATVVALPMPVTAARVEVVFRSNHGGSYAGLAELQLR